MESPHMRSVPVALLATAVLSGAVAAGILLQGSEHLSFAAPPEAPEETRAIPLESCYANFGRGGWKIIRDDSREPYGYDQAQLFRDHKGGASNIVLVRGNNIAAAVKATRWAFTAGRWADTPISCYQDGRKGEGEDIWLVAYLGSGSCSAVWQLHAASITDRVAQLTYSRMIPLSGTADFRHFFVWVPLGRPKAGSYLLELRDKDRNEAMLLRRVIVAEP